MTIQTINKQALIQGLKTNPKDFVHRFFKNERGMPLVLTGYQNRQLAALLSPVLKNKPGKFLFRQCRRSGKSELISVFIAIVLLLRPVKIANISFTADQASIIFERVKAHLVDDSEWARSQVNLGQSMVSKREFSRSRFFMLSGGQFRIFSTGRGETEFTGESMLGFGADIVVIDEDASIPDSVHRTKISPLTMDARSSKIIVRSGTPHRRGDMHVAEMSGKYQCFHVGWQEAVAEGQVNETDVLSAKNALSPREFRVWWEAEWPDDNADQLIRSKWIKTAQRDARVRIPADWRTLGVDVARFGKDLTVFTYVEFHGGLAVVRSIESYPKISTMQTVGLIKKFASEFPVDKIIIDDGGVGGGVVDRLREFENLEDKVEAFLFGSVPFKLGPKKPFLRVEEKLANSTFLNKKSFYYGKLAKYFEKGAIVIPKHDEVLAKELVSIRETVTSDGKAKIVDDKEEGMSPDFADSLMMAISGIVQDKILVDWT